MGERLKRRDYCKRCHKRMVPLPMPKVGLGASLPRTCRCRDGGVDPGPQPGQSRSGEVARLQGGPSGPSTGPSTSARKP